VTADNAILSIAMLSFTDIIIILCVHILTKYVYKLIELLQVRRMTKLSWSSNWMKYLKYYLRT